MSEIIKATVPTDDIIVNVNETLLYKGDKGDKGDPGSIENLEVGGRNLLIGTNNGANNWDFSSSDGNIIKSSKNFTELENVNGVRFDIKENSTGWSFLSYQSDNIRNIIRQSQGKKFTISFDFKSDISSFVNVLIENTNGTGAMVDFGVISFNANEWKHVELTSSVINTTVENQVIYMYTETLLKNATYVEIANLKLERGEIATDWTPAIEDYERNTLSYANMESTTASHTYSVGDFLEVNGSLKKVTLAIAQGQEINSSNTVDTTITDELKAIYALINK